MVDRQGGLKICDYAALFSCAIHVHTLVFSRGKGNHSRISDSKIDSEFDGARPAPATPIIACSFRLALQHVNTVTNQRSQDERQMVIMRIY